MAFKNVLDTGPEDGTTFGKDATALISFYGFTPIAQPAGAAQVALTAVTAGAVGFGTTAGFSAAVAQLEEIRATLVEFGLLKGAA